MAFRPPQQARSRATWDRVLDAGVEILEREGHEALTIAALCERAGVTPPTVYARAPDKQTLLVAIHRRAVDRLDADSQLTGPLAPADATRELARTFFAHAPLLRAIFQLAAADEAVFEQGSRATAAVSRRFREAVGGDAQRADALVRVLIGALAHRVVYGQTFDSDLAQPDADFIHALEELAELYLGAEV